ncbi:MAG: hypothetical protein AAGC60_21720 [Acidobacteriota bacterium]
MRPLIGLRLSPRTSLRSVRRGSRGGLLGLVALTSAVLAVLAAAPAIADSLEVGRMVRPVPLEDRGTLRLEVPSGDVRLQPASVDRVELELVLRCAGAVGRCRQDAEQVELLTETRGDATVVGVSGPESYGYSGKWLDRFFVGRAVTRCGQQVYGGAREGMGRGGWRLDIDLVVRYPRGQALELLVGEGAVTLERHEGPALLDVGSGEVTVRMPRRVLADVELRAKRGQAALGGVDRKTLRGRKLSWSGDGEHELVARVDRGAVKVSLY